jgi:hypothetical protein
MLERGMVQPVSSNVPTYIDVITSQGALRARFRPPAARLQHTGRRFMIGLLDRPTVAGLLPVESKSLHIGKTSAGR